MRLVALSAVLLALFARPLSAQPCPLEPVPGYHYSTLSYGTPSFSLYEGSFRCAAVFDDGTGPVIYVGGVGNVTDEGSANLHIFRDGRWHAVHGFTFPVRALAVANTPQGQRLYAAGTFTAIPGSQTPTDVAMFDGQTWTPVGNQLPSFSYLRGMVAYEGPNGTCLYVIGEGPTPLLRHWDGSTWSYVTMPAFDSFPIDPNIQGLRAIAYFDDGSGPKLYIAAHGFWGDERVVGVAAYDGTSWTYFPGLVGSPDSRFTSFAVLPTPDGPRLFLAGTLFGPEQSEPSALAQLVDGVWQVIPTPPIQPGSSIGASAIAPFETPTGPAVAVVVGEYAYNGPKMVRLYQDGVWTDLPGTFHSGILSLYTNIHCFVTLPDSGELCAIGSFDKVDDREISSAASWDGSRWLPIEQSGLGSFSSNFVVEDVTDPSAVYIGTRRHTAGAAAQTTFNFPVLSLAQWNDPQPTLFLGTTSRAYYNDGSGWVSLMPDVVGYSVRYWNVVMNGVPTLFQTSSLGLKRREGGVWIHVEPTPSINSEIFALATYEGPNGTELFVTGRASGEPGYFCVHRVENEWVPFPMSGQVRTMLAADMGMGAELFFAVSPYVVGQPGGGIFAWNGSTLRDASAGLPPNTPVYDLRILNIGSGPQLWCAAGNALYFWNGAAWETRPEWSTNGTINSFAATHNADGSRSIFVSGNFSLMSGIRSNKIAELRTCILTCSSDFDNDGDAGTEADIEAFFACLAGNCCPTCGLADFDNDGDSGTDADIEAFFRVLAGGSC